MEWMNRFIAITDVLSRADETGLGITEIAARTNLAKGTLHRILLDMVKNEIAVRDERTKRYQLGPRPMIWASRFVAGKDISAALAPFCRDLSRATHFYSYISRYTAGEVYCIYAHQPEDERRTYFVHVGQRMPVHAASAAKSILAFRRANEVSRVLKNVEYTHYTENTIDDVDELRHELARGREEHLSWCIEEMEAGVSAISAPILDTEEHATFSMSIVGNHQEIMKHKELLCDLLKDYAERASSYLQTIRPLMTLR